MDEASKTALPGRDRLSTLCLILVVVLTLTWTVVGAAVRPAMFSDSGWGLQGWDTRARAPGFNNSAGPDPADISRDETGFMSNWSPGQHLLPGLLELAGMSLGLAIVAVTAVFSVLGLAGWFALYRAVGFPTRSAMVALLVVACSRFFNLPFAIYNGGEVLLFGVAPWFVLLVWSLRELRWSAVPALVAGTAVLVFAKLSGLIVAFAAMGAAAVCADRAWLKRETVRKMLVAATAAGSAAVIFYFSWFVHGPTPASIVTEPHPIGLPFYLAFVIGALWSASLSLGDLASYLFLHPSRPVLPTIDAVYFAFLVVAMPILGLSAWRLRRDHGEYLRFSYLAAAAMSAFLVLLWLRGNAVSFDERHLRIASLLLLIGVVHAFIDYPVRVVRTVVVALFIAASLYGVASFAVRTKANLDRPLGARGTRQLNANAQALEFLHRIDAPGPGGEAPVVVVMSPELGLELRQARVFPMQADFDTLADLETRIVRGRVARIYALMPAKLIENGKAAAILKSFVDYPVDEWQSVPLGDYVAYYQDRPR